MADWHDLVLWGLAWCASGFLTMLVIRIFTGPQELGVWVYQIIVGPTLILIMIGVGIWDLGICAIDKVWKIKL